jgi:hypothetical protein
MTRPRRSRRIPAPRGLGEISYCEQSLWVGRGPLLEGDGAVPTDNTLPGSDRPAYHIWPDMNTFMRFYETVRETWHPDRPWVRERAAVERLYKAWTGAEDLAAVRQAINAERRQNDPRRPVMPWLESGGS